jgi:hypothetical protein
MLAMADLQPPPSSGPGDRCSEGLSKIREIAREIVGGNGEPMWLAKAIFQEGFEHGAFSECPELAGPTFEFLELYEAIELHQDNTESKAAYSELIREAAEAFLEGRPFPEWNDKGRPDPLASRK